MTAEYTYDPDTWPPALAGAVAGSIAAIMAAVIAFFLRSPDELVANSLTVVLASIVIGLLSGLLWRRLRAGDNALTVFGWSMAGGFVAAMLGVTLGDRFVLDNLLGYAAPLTAVIFLTLGFLVPLLSTAKAPLWIAAVPILIALGLGVGLFGRGNVADGDLSLDDLPVVTTTEAAIADTTVPSDAVTDTTQAEPPAELTGEISVPDDLAASFTVSSAIVTYTVPEIRQGLSTVGVGESTSLTGTIKPGESFVFMLDLQSFTSDQSRRDGRVRGWFEEFPQGTFGARSFDLPSTTVIGEVSTFEVTGDLIINQIAMETTWVVQARVEADGSLSVQGETDIVLSDFDIPVVTGFVTMEDSAHLEVLLTATPDS
jgi:hypothetical protein